MVVDQEPRLVTIEGTPEDLTVKVGSLVLVHDGLSHWRVFLDGRPLKAKSVTVDCQVQSVPRVRVEFYP